MSLSQSKMTSLREQLAQEEEVKPVKEVEKKVEKKAGKNKK